MFPSVRHLYTATSDGETMTCVTCELQVQPSLSLKTFSRIMTRIFARIIGSLQTSRGEFCQRSSVLPNWSFSHYVHSCLGQVGPRWSVFWRGRWLWMLANLVSCKLGCLQTWLLVNLAAYKLACLQGVPDVVLRKTSDHSIVFNLEDNALLNEKY